ncbi:MAG TPA: hypothetical protein VFJ84_02180 [Candidatus Saccharimonadales bacterium]|nr:hypothetical protein [Candidatus Saccharimonadales bacterium]
MAITEFESGAEPGNSSENHAALHIVPSSPALGEAVQITPVEESVPALRPVEPFEDFKTYLHGLIREGDYDHKSLEELVEIKGDIQEVREALTARYAELARLEAVLQREMTWTNGYLIDINKAIQAKQQP